MKVEHDEVVVGGDMFDYRIVCSSSKCVGSSRSIRILVMKQRDETAELSAASSTHGIQLVLARGE